jgi:hypothetical protein
MMREKVQPDSPMHLEKEFSKIFAFEPNASDGHASHRRGTELSPPMLPPPHAAAAAIMLLLPPQTLLLSLLLLPLLLLLLPPPPPPQGGGVDIRSQSNDTHRKTGHLLKTISRKSTPIPGAF